MEKKLEELLNERDALKRRVDYLENETRRLSTLLSVGRAISWELDLNNLLDLAMKEITRALDAERSTLFLIDWDRAELWSMVAQGSPEIRVSIKQGIAGFVALTGETLLIDDAYADHRFNREVDTRSGYRTRTILAMPIRNRRAETIGVIEALNKRKGTFDFEDQELLGALSSQVAIALENAQLYSEVKETFDSFIRTLVATIDARHRNTSGHSERVREYALEIGKRMNLNDNELELLSYAAILHDLGKIGVDDRILKKPGKLSPDEYSEMKNHPLFTRQILERIHLGRLHRNLPNIAADHHERLDGSGYPQGLTGEEISILTRILAVADVFDALTHWREYRDPLDGHEALEILKEESKERLDREVVRVFEDYYNEVNLAERLTRRTANDKILSSD